jgi:hypothetical protein
MLEQVKQTESRDLEWTCQAVSPMDELRRFGGLPLRNMRAMVLRGACRG